MTTDQSRPDSRVSVVEALTQIRALCAESDKWHSGDGNILVSDLRAVLDAVSVDATPAQGIDRDALVSALGQVRGDQALSGSLWTDQEWADRILALVRPVEGVVLSPGEARLAENALREYGMEPYTLDYADMDAMNALADRLEEAAS